MKSASERLVPSDEEGIFWYASTLLSVAGVHPLHPDDEDDDTCPGGAIDRVFATLIEVGALAIGIDTAATPVQTLVTVPALGSDIPTIQGVAGLDCTRVSRSGTTEVQLFALGGVLQRPDGSTKLPAPTLALTTPPSIASVVPTT